MQKPTMSLAEVRHVLARQNEQLQAAYAAAESGKTVQMDPAALKALADVCTTRTKPRSADAPADWAAVRC